MTCDLRKFFGFGIQQGSQDFQTMSESSGDSQETLVMAGADLQKDQDIYGPGVTLTPPVLDNDRRAQGNPSPDQRVWLTTNNGHCFHRTRLCSVGPRWNNVRLMQVHAFVKTLAVHRK